VLRNLLRTLLRNILAPLLLFAFLLLLYSFSLAFRLSLRCAPLLGVVAECHNVGVGGTEPLAFPRKG